MSLVLSESFENAVVDVIAVTSVYLIGVAASGTESMRD